MQRLLLALAVLALTAVVEARPAELPKHFRAHNEDWTILRVKHLAEGRTAETDCGARTISMLSDIAHPYDRAVTLMHELMHVLGCDQGLPHDARWNNSDDETDAYEGHQGIYLMAPELVELMVENPELVAYIQDQGGRK